MVKTSMKRKMLCMVFRNV